MKTESSKTESSKTEPLKTETPKTESPEAGSPKDGSSKTPRIILSIMIIVAVFLLAVNAAVFMSGRAGRYRKAIKAEQAGDIKTAYRLYRDLGGYRNAREKADSMEQAEPRLKFSAAEEGEILTFGSFEQDGNMQNGVEPLEWIVLDRREDRVLLLSRYVLACIPYHEEDEELTWETCSLRNWLNCEFTENTFTEEERALLLEVENTNPGNDRYETKGGNDTRDRIFLLSTEEGSAYFHEKEAQLITGRGEPTQVAIDQGVLATEEEGADAVYSPWWLRGPGVYQNSAAFMDENGCVYDSGAIVNNDYFCGVRPALWVGTEDPEDAGQP